MVKFKCSCTVIDKKYKRSTFSIEIKIVEDVTAQRMQDPQVINPMEFEGIGEKGI
jgi:hypothetical protein